MNDEGDRISSLANRALDSAPTLAIAAVDELSGIRSVEAATALRRVSEESEQGPVRKAARRALHKLVTLGFPPTEQREPVNEPRRTEQWPIYKAISSPVDGIGARGIWIGFGGGSEVTLLALLLGDEKGIMDLASQTVARSLFDKQVSHLLADEGAPWAEIPADYARQLVEEAHSLNLATRTKLPLDYLAWRERIGKPQHPYERPAIYSMVNSAEVRWDPQFLDGSGQLMGLPLFQVWILDKDEMTEFVRERMLVHQSGLVIAGARPEDRNELAVDHAIQKLFGTTRRTLYKRRLEEMSLLLWQMERSYQAKMALAAALAMDPPDRSLTDHPFVRAMTQWSMDVVAEMEEETRTRSVKPGVKIELPY